MRKLTLFLILLLLGAILFVLFTWNTVYEQSIEILDPQEVSIGMNLIRSTLDNTFEFSYTVDPYTGVVTVTTWSEGLGEIFLVNQNAWPNFRDAIVGFYEPWSELIQYTTTGVSILILQYVNDANLAHVFLEVQDGEVIYDTFDN